LLRKYFLLITVILLVYVGCSKQNNVEVFPQLGHNGFVLSVAISSDGKRILSGAIDNSIKLWDTESGREIRTFVGHGDKINTVLFSPDGKHIVSGSADHTIKFWDIETGKNIRTFSGHTGGVNSVAFINDGKQIISSADDGYITIWDVETEKEIKSYYEEDGIIDYVTVSPDGKKIIYSYISYHIPDEFTDIPDENYTSALWEYILKYHKRELVFFDLETEQEISAFSMPHSQKVFVSFNPNGKQIVCGSDNGCLKLWDVEKGQDIITFSEPTEDLDYSITSVAFSPDRKYVISSSRDCNIKYWDVITGKLIRTFYLEFYAIFGSIVFSSDGKYILSGSDNGINLWDIETGQVIRSYIGYSYYISIALFHPYEKKILSGLGSGPIESDSDTIDSDPMDSDSIGGTLKLWDIENGRQIRTFTKHLGGVNTAAFSPDSKQILSCDFSQIKLWNTETGMEIGYINDWSIESVAFSPNGEHFLFGTYKNIIIADMESMEVINVFPGNDMHSVSTVYSNDGKKIFSYTDGNIIIWDVESGLEIRRFKGHGDILSVTFSNDGKYILSGSDDKIIKLWDIETGEDIKTFSGHIGSVNSMAFSQDDKYIISGSDDSTIKLWDINTGKEIKSFYGHTSRVRSVAFSQDGNSILSSSVDGTIRLWDIAVGKEIASFISFTDGEWIVITPDGYYNASPKGDERLNVRIGSEVFGIDQFAAAFYQPEVVQARLRGKKDPLIVKLRGDIRQATAPPSVDIKVINRNTDTAELAVNIFDQFKPIGKINIEITVNGRLLSEDELKAVKSKSVIYIKPDNTRLLVSSKKQEMEFNIPVILEPGSNYIEIIAANDYSYGLKRIILNTPETKIIPGGDLWILAIGVNNFTKNIPRSGFDNLNYPASDIEKVIRSFKDQEGPEKRYNKVRTLIISDNEPIKPTKQTILANMEFLKKAKPNDTVLLFLSGHGKTQNGEYYFLPSDTVFSGGGKFDPDSAVNGETLVKALDIPGRKIAMLDTCDSGGADTNNRLVRTLKNRSTVVFTASQEGESAWEDIEYGGFFAHSIAEGISGKAASGNLVQIVPLGEYISERVAALNKETGTPQQNPVKYIPDGFRNFVISLAK